MANLRNMDSTCILHTELGLSNMAHGPEPTLGPTYSTVDFLPCILLEMSIRAGSGVSPRFFTFIGDRAKGVGSILALTVKYLLFVNNEFYCFVIKTY